MASFPTSVKTFTNKSAGQTIASAHMNDVQDEVNAIESGYLTGTARLNSSNSTVATLSVTGGSTFGGNVSIAANLTSTGVLTLTNSSASHTLSGGLNVGGGSTVFALQAGNSTLSNLSVSSNLGVGGQVSFGSALTPATLSSGDTHNYQPTGFGSAFALRITGSSNGSTITGFGAPGTDGRFLLVINAGADPIGFVHNSGASSASGRMTLCGSSNISLTANQRILFWYDATNSFYTQITRI